MRRPPRWSPAGSPQSAGLPVDFFATRAHYIDHIAPVWSALDQRGLFCVPDELASHARSRGVKPAPLSELAAGDGPIVTSAYADMSRCTKSQRHLIMFEHGAGFSFSNVHPSYAGGSHDRRFVSLFCEVNDWTQRRNLRTFHDARSHVVGCPKLDDLEHYREKLHHMFAASRPERITVVRMEVPCCGGIAHATIEARNASAPDCPLEVHTVGIGGGIRREVVPPAA